MGPFNDQNINLFHLYAIEKIPHHARFPTMVA